MQKYTFYVGAGFTHDGRPLEGGPKAPEFFQIENYLLWEYPGFTKTLGEGAYTAKNGLITREVVVIYTLFVNPNQSFLPTKMQAVAAKLAELAEQESVLVEHRDWGELVFNPSL